MYRKQHTLCKISCKQHEALQNDWPLQKISRHVERLHTRRRARNIYTLPSIAADPCLAGERQREGEKKCDEDQVVFIPFSRDHRGKQDKDKEDVILRWL